MSSNAEPVEPEVPETDSSNAEHTPEQPSGTGASAQGEDAIAAGERAVVTGGDNAGVSVAGDGVTVTQIAFSVLPSQPGHAPGRDQLLANLDAAIAKVSTPEAQAAAQQARAALAREADDKPKPADNVLRDVTLLLAQGFVLWQPETSAAGLDNAEHVIVSMTTSALWPLVVARTFSDEQRQAVAALASDDVARAVMMARSVNPNKQPDKAAHQLTQNLVNPMYLPGLMRLLNHLRDPNLGYPALCAARLLRNQPPPPPPKPQRSAGEFALEAMKWAGLAAVGGVIGNRIDALFVQTAQAAKDVLQPTSSPAATSAVVAEATPSQPLRLARSTGIDVIDQMQFCWVPEGEFWMGAAAHDKTTNEEERPIHRVYLSNYAMGRYPVTNAQFDAFTRATGYVTERERAKNDWNWRSPKGKDSTLSGKALHPVRCLTWNDTHAFCNWLSGLCATRIGLPSEAQWEKAARGGLQIPLSPVTQTLASIAAPASVTLTPNPMPQRTFPWGERSPISALCNVYFDDTVSRIDDTTPVGQHSAAGSDSPYACSDMADNVWEWCQDWYDAGIYKTRQSQLAADPMGPSMGEYRVLRGGAFGFSQGGARCTCRY